MSIEIALLIVTTAICTALACELVRTMVERIKIYRESRRVITSLESLLREYNVTEATVIDVDSGKSHSFKTPNKDTH